MSIGYMIRQETTSPLFRNQQMRLNLDLPKYKWNEIYHYLEQHINESENVAALCNAIKIGSYEKSLNQKIYTFLFSHGLNTAQLPSTREIKKYKGGSGLVKEIYYGYGLSHPKVQKEYSEFIKNNFKLVPLEEAHV